MNKYKLFFFVIILTSAFSCGEYELLEYQKECKRKADSTFKAELKHLTGISDSLCNLNYDKYFQASLDSLIPARKNEIKNLISK